MVHGYHGTIKLPPARGSLLKAQSRCIGVLMYCWIGVGPACPTRPPHQRGTELVDELEDLRLCESEGIQPIGDQRYDGMRNGAYDALLRTSAARGSLRPLSSRRELDIIYFP